MAEKVVPPKWAIDGASSRVAGRKVNLALSVGLGVQDLEDSHCALVSWRGAGDGSDGEVVAGAMWIEFDGRDVGV